MVWGLTSEILATYGCFSCTISIPEKLQHAKRFVLTLIGTDLAISDSGTIRRTT